MYARTSRAEIGGRGTGNLLKPPVKCMVQNETRGFSFRKNSKKMARVHKSGVVFLYMLVCFLSDDDDDENCCQQTLCIRTLVRTD